MEDEMRFPKLVTTLESNLGSRWEVHLDFDGPGGFVTIRRRPVARKVEGLTVHEHPLVYCSIQPYFGGFEAKIYYDRTGELAGSVAWVKDGRKWRKGIRDVIRWCQQEDLLAAGWRADIRRPKGEKPTGRWFREGEDPDVAPGMTFEEALKTL